VKDCRDAVADRLPVTVGQRHVDREIDAGARHHLPFEGVAVKVDDPGQHQQAIGIDAGRAAAMVRTDSNNVAAGDLQRGIGNSGAEQDPAAFDQ
jgi:hypothetical protein